MKTCVISYELHKCTRPSPPPATVHKITADLNESLEQADCLSDRIQYSMEAPQMYYPCISWRYFAVVTSFGGDNDYERLQVFDSLADWKYSLTDDSDDGGEYDTESGIHFNCEEEEDASSDDS